jgi:Arc/MetJ family transcription regulator
MRTNIDIDDELMARVLAAGPFKTKKEAVEAGLRMLERQAAYREILKWRGKLQWGWGDEERLNGEPNWSQAQPQGQPETPMVQEPKQAYAVKSSRKPAASSSERKRHARR